jgi:hypothetical protein
MSETPDRLFERILVVRCQAGDETASAENDWNEWIRAFNACAEIILACMAALLLAAVSTLLLVFASRRATLRQINANLAAISEELKQLRQSSERS